MDFSNKNLFEFFTMNDKTYYVTQSILATWIVMAILIAFAIVVRFLLTKWQSVPGGFQNVVETLVETMTKFTVSTMGKTMEGFSGYFFTIFSFILLSNYSSLFFLRPPTSDIATTGALAIATFLIVQIGGIYVGRKRYIKDLFEPVPIFLPLNIIGEISKPISLAFRLFGNMLGGVIIMGLVYEMLPIALRFVLPAVLHAYFDLFAGALQAFIFTVLSMTFIAQKTTTES